MQAAFYGEYKLILGRITYGLQIFCKFERFPVESINKSGYFQNAYFLNNY